ncbi:helix-turn-helix domain-containing protein [Kribbella sp. NPDC055071]
MADTRLTKASTTQRSGKTASTKAAGGPSAFGAQLRQCRQAVGLSLRQLSGRVGYDHSYLSQVERGQRLGSADLARLCDRELGTGTQLTALYAEAHSEPPRRRPPVDNLPMDPLAAAWQELAGGCSGVDEDADPQSVPPGALLPELVSELRLLQARGPDGVTAFSARVTRQCVLIAETLTALGEARGATRWWWAGRAVADDSGEGWLRSEVRVAEAVSGMAERRPLPHLLELADEALALAHHGRVRLSIVVRAHALRARVLAAMGEAAEAHRALQELLSCSDALPSATTQDLAPYQVHGLEGRVCAGLGYGPAGCLLLGRAVELCPEERVGERARLQVAQAECLAVDGEVTVALAVAMRVLVELPDEWHTYYLYDDAHRVLSATREREPGLSAVRDLEVLLERKAYQRGRSVGSGSWSSEWRG